MNDKQLIIFVDDDEDDRLIFEEGFMQAGCKDTFLHFESGPLLMDYLNAASREELPSMILLDLNMPLLDGREVLRLVKANPAWSHIPVIIFTTSGLPKDRQICYQYGANCFITKPSGYQEVLDITKSISSLWCR